MELPDNWHKLFKINLVDCYIDRPNLLYVPGKYAPPDSFCSATVKVLLPKDNDNHPEEKNF